MKLQFVSVAVFVVLGLVTFFGTANATNDDNKLDAAIDLSTKATAAANEAGARATAATTRATENTASATVAAADANAAAVTTDTAGVAATAAQKTAYDAYYAQPQVQSTVDSSAKAAVIANNLAKSAAISTAALAEASRYASNQATYASRDAIKAADAANVAGAAATEAGAAVTRQLANTPDPEILPGQSAAAAAAAAAAVASAAVAKAGGIAATNASLALDPVAIAACKAARVAAHSSRTTMNIADNGVAGQ